MKKNHSLSHAGNTPVRQGVTLLLVLTLMSVFAMLIITFMIIASHARRTAQLTAQHLLVPSAAAVGDRFDLDDALAVLLFGS
ncbi:MAG: hypothetical protein LBH00_08670, partial [Planctomycetaceae bacterium]|nr:hypothetical protein [Planctomycetaceae bacterium]